MTRPSDADMVGYWRSDLTTVAICSLTGLKPYQVYEIWSRLKHARGMLPNQRRPNPSSSDRGRELRRLKMERQLVDRQQVQRRADMQRQQEHFTVIAEARNAASVRTMAELMADDFDDSFQAGGPTVGHDHLLRRLIRFHGPDGRSDVPEALRR